MVGVGKQRKRDWDGEPVQMKVPHAPASGLSLSASAAGLYLVWMVRKDYLPTAGTDPGVRTRAVLERLVVEARRLEGRKGPRHAANDVVRRVSGARKADLAGEGSSCTRQLGRHPAGRDADVHEVEGNQPQVTLLRNEVVPRRRSSNTTRVPASSTPGGVVGFGVQPVVVSPAASVSRGIVSVP